MESLVMHIYAAALNAASAQFHKRPFRPTDQSPRNEHLIPPSPLSTSFFCLARLVAEVTGQDYFSISSVASSFNAR